MKRVINGKTYNTETATEIASDGYNGSYSDFQWLSETLYRSPKGQYFLAGEGGPMSRYSTPIGNNGRGGGSGLELLTEAEALDWCECHQISAERIAAHFHIEEG